MTNSTHLERMSIHGFRGLERLELEDLRQLNLIVGQNDIGKTSVLEAATLLSGATPQALVGRTFEYRVSTTDAVISAVPTTTVGDPEDFLLSARLLVPGLGPEAASISDALIAKRQDELLECLRAVHPSISGIATKNDVAYVDIGLDAMIPLSTCGSGLVRTVAIFAACLSGKVQMLLIDEIGAGLHHSAVRPLLEALLAVSEQRNVQVFVTTHSLEVLRSLEKTLRDEYFARFRDRTAAYTLARRQDGRICAYRYDYEQFAHTVSNEIEIR